MRNSDEEGSRRAINIQQWMGKSVKIRYENRGCGITRENAIKVL